MRRKNIDIIRDFNKYIRQKKFEEDENKLKRSKLLLYI